MWLLKKIKNQHLFSFGSLNFFPTQGDTNRKKKIKMKENYNNDKKHVIFNYRFLVSEF